MNLKLVTLFCLTEMSQISRLFFGMFDGNVEKLYFFTRKEFTWSFNIRSETGCYSGEANSFNLTL